MDNDEMIERIAAEIESGDILDLAPCGARTKRAKQDHEIRRAARQELRSHLAGIVRAFKSGRGLDPLRLLEEIADGDDKTVVRFAWGPQVAYLLAIEYVALSVEVNLDTHLESCKPTFRLRLTKRGKKVLEDRRAAVRPSGGGDAGARVETAAQEKTP